jgi:soluble lytic murein transglycosylase-like protein
MWGYVLYGFNNESKMIQETVNDGYCASDKVSNDMDDQKEAISQENTITSNNYKRSARSSIPHPYREIIYSRAKKYEIKPSLVSAVITIESNWNSKAISPVGAKGLMQLMPATAKEMGVTDPFNPHENIEGGARYLRHLLDRFDGDVTLALAAYNAGPRRIRRFKGIPPIRETQRYVTKVLEVYQREENAIF